MPTSLSNSPLGISMSAVMPSDHSGVVAVPLLATFQDLPEDILLEILYLLDTRSIMRFRRLCRQCASATRAFSVWSTAFGNANHGPKGCDYRLGRAIKSYTASELEAIVVKLARLGKNWTSASPAPVRTRPLPLGATAFAELVHGGRWLITGSVDGSGRVWYRDLEAEVITPQVLLQWVEDQPCDGMRVALSIDGESDRLSFTIAVEFCDVEAGPEPDAASKMSIWAVHTSDDGNHLVARFLHSFDVFGHESSRGLCIFGDTLLRGRKDERSIEVFDWPRCTSQTHLKTVIKLRYGRSCKAIRVLPNRRILGVSRLCVFVFDIKDPAQMAPNHRLDTMDVSEPTWVYEFNQARRNNSIAVSPPIHYRRSFPDVVPLLIHYGQYMHTFAFRSTPSFEAEVAKYQLTQPQDTQASVGWRRSVSTTGRPPSQITMSLINLDVCADGDRETSSESFVRHKVTERDCQFGVEVSPYGWIFFDEYSGVALVTENDDMECNILYFA